MKHIKLFEAFASTSESSLDSKQEPSFDWKVKISNLGLDGSSPRNLVVAIDTSGSIDRASTNTFFTETLHLIHAYQPDHTTILYVSDDVDAVEELGRGDIPDFSKMRSTGGIGGTQGGFNSPFKWLEEHSVEPSLLVYFTDGMDEIHSVISVDGLSEYVPDFADRVIWVHCYNFKSTKDPAFGQVARLSKTVFGSEADIYGVTPEQYNQGLSNAQIDSLLNQSLDNGDIGIAREISGYLK